MPRTTPSSSSKTSRSSTTSCGKPTSRKNYWKLPPLKWRWVNRIYCMNKGKIVQIIGPVVDIEFPDKLPALYNALTVEFTPPGAPAPFKLTLEVQQHLGDNWVRAVAM